MQALQEGIVKRLDIKCCPNLDFVFLQNIIKPLSTRWITRYPFAVQNLHA